MSTTAPTATATFAAVYALLHASHTVSDYWVQTGHQAVTKGGQGAAAWAGRWACTKHVASLTLVQLGALLGAGLVLGLRLGAVQLGAGLAVNAVSHWWADRRHTLAALAALVPGKAAFWQLGLPRPGHDDLPTLGTGAAALDQAWHVGWLAVAALVIAAGD